MSHSLLENSFDLQVRNHYDDDEGMPVSIPSLHDLPTIEDDVKGASSRDEVE